MGATRLISFLVGIAALAGCSGGGDDEQTRADPQAQCSAVDGQRYDASAQCFAQPNELAGICASSRDAIPSAAFGPACVVSMEGNAFLVWLGASTDLTVDARWRELAPKAAWPDNFPHYAMGTPEATQCAPVIEAASSIMSGEGRDCPSP